MNARTLIFLTAVSAWAQTPDPETQKAMVARMREAALTYSDHLRDFRCNQFAARSTGAAPDAAKWKALETQEAEIDYVDHREHFKLLRVNGQTTDLEKRVKQGHFITGYGQFGTLLRKIFEPQSQAEFEWDRREGGACVFRYRIAKEHSAFVIHADLDNVTLGHHGTVWSDCETGAVTRYYMESDTGEVRRKLLHVPLAFRVDVRYAPAAIGGQEFLLPQSALQFGLFYKTWTKAEIQFRDYRKYDANSTVRFDDK